MKTMYHPMKFAKFIVPFFNKKRFACMSQCPRIFQKQNGFSLIELMIAVAVVGILAGFALPSYRQYVMRAHRVDARNALLALAQRLEQNYTLSGSYALLQDGTTTVTDTTIANWGLDKTPLSGGTRYNISFDTGSPTATAFTIKATPTGSQTGDTCGNLTLDNRNLKGAAGQNNRHTTTRDCWDK